MSRFYGLIVFALALFGLIAVGCFTAPASASPTTYTPTAAEAFLETVGGACIEWGYSQDDGQGGCNASSMPGARALCGIDRRGFSVSVSASEDDDSGAIRFDDSVRIKVNLKSWRADGSINDDGSGNGSIYDATGAQVGTWMRWYASSTNGSSVPFDGGMPQAILQVDDTTTGQHLGFRVACR